MHFERILKKIERCGTGGDLEEINGHFVESCKYWSFLRESSEPHIVQINQLRGGWGLKRCRCAVGWPGEEKTKDFFFLLGWHLPQDHYKGPITHIS